MDFSFLIQDLISAAVIWVLSFAWRRLRRTIRSTGEDVPSQERMPKEKLHRHFLFWLFGLLLSTIIFFSVDGSASSIFLVFFKVFAGISVFFCFILTWGAFDAAFAFYPPDENEAELLTDKPADHNGNDS